MSLSKIVDNYDHRCARTSSEKRSLRSPTAERWESESCGCFLCTRTPVGCPEPASASRDATCAGVVMANRVGVEPCEWDEAPNNLTSDATTLAVRNQATEINLGLQRSCRRVVNTPADATKAIGEHTKCMGCVW